MEPKIVITKEQIIAVAKELSTVYHDEETEFMSAEDWLGSTMNWLRRVVNEVLFNPAQYATGLSKIDQAFELRPRCIKPFCNLYADDGEILCRSHLAAYDALTEPPATNWFEP